MPNHFILKLKFSKALVNGLEQLPARLGQNIVFIQTINGQEATQYAGMDALRKAGLMTSGSGLQLRLTSGEAGRGPSGVPGVERRYSRPIAAEPGAIDLP